jgi:uncharacterized repeat protein (TIGR01451 family)
MSMSKALSNHRVASITLLAAFIVLGAAQDAYAAKRARNTAAEEGAGWYNESYIVAQPTSVLLCATARNGSEIPAGQPCTFGFRLNVDGVAYDRLWVYPDGYVSLANAASPALALDPNHSSAAALPGNIIAPLYSAVAQNLNNGCTGLDFTNDCDLSINWYPDPDDNYGNDGDGNPLPPPDRLGFRVSWGLAGTWETDVNGDIADANHTRGIRPAAPANDIHGNRFQMRLWDRKNGDFDVEFIIDILEWEIGETGATPRSVAGFKIGAYSLNFGDWFNSFVGANLDGGDLLATLADVRARTCPDSQPQIDDDVPFFSKENLYVCNNITIRFTGGVPALLGYTAPLSVAPVNPAGTTYTDSDAVLGWTVTNAGPETATSGRLSLTLPAAASYVSSTGATCTPTGQAIDCTLADLAANASAEVRVTVHSTQPGTVAVEATAVADQYDPTPANNLATASVDFTAHADLRVDSCTGINSPTVGNGATLTCTVSNLGPQPATGVALTVTLPSQLTFSSSSGCTASGATLTCTAATLASGANTSFAAQLNAAASGSGTIGATLAAATPADTVAANNTLNTAITVQAAQPPQPPTKKGGGALQWWALACLLELARRRARLQPGATLT